MKLLATWLLLVSGAAIVLYLSIDVSLRLAYWEGRPDYPNIDPRVMYALSLFILAAIAALAGVVELLRARVFRRRRLLWWQAVVVGGSYATFFTGVALRHYLEPGLAFHVTVIAALTINPVTTCYLFGGFGRDAGAINGPENHSR